MRVISGQLRFLVFKVLRRLGINFRETNYGWSFRIFPNRPTAEDLSLEIGSRDALDAIDIAKFFGCRVIAFGPVPENILICHQNLLGANPDIASLIDVDERCLSSKSGTVIFWAIDQDLYSNNGAGSMFHLNFDNRSPTDIDYKRQQIQKPICVDAVRFDESGIQAPHTIFLDVQGSELEVLQGFGAKLNQIQNIVLECSLVSTYTDGCNFEDLDSFLIEHGFRFIYSTKHRGKKPKTENNKMYQGEFSAIYSRVA